MACHRFSCLLDHLLDNITVGVGVGEIDEDRK